MLPRLLTTSIAGSSSIHTLLAHRERFIHPSFTHVHTLRHHRRRRRFVSPSSSPAVIRSPPSSPVVRLAVAVVAGHPLAAVVAVRSLPSTYVVSRTARHLHRPQAATRRRCSSTSLLHAYRRKAKARLEFMATSLLPC